MDYRLKYIKYKIKYLELKKKDIHDSMIGGNKKKLKKKSINYTSSNNKINLKNKQSRMEGQNLSEDNKPNYVENVSEPWFSFISMGLKSVEGRRNKGRFKDMRVGDIVEWTNNDFAPRKVLTRIVSKSEYSSFKEYLETEGLDKCLPGIKDIDTGLSVYYKYFTKEDEKEYGVIAIKIELI
jgi:ASC-1-like (ASCH) protein